MPVWGKGRAVPRVSTPCGGRPSTVQGRVRVGEQSVRGACVCGVCVVRVSTLRSEAAFSTQSPPLRSS